MIARSLVLPLVLFASGALVGHQLAARTRAPNPTPSDSTANLHPLRELVLVYIGASTCGPSNDPRIASWIREAMDSLRSRSRSIGAGVVAIGIARELDVSAGINHLARTARFDEISAGQRERNNLSQKFISQAFPGIAATPQVVVLLREYDDLPLGGVNVSSVRETLLLRRVGLQEVENWIRLGAPTPSAVAPAPSFGTAVPF